MYIYLSFLRRKKKIDERTKIECPYKWQLARIEAENIIVIALFIVLFEIFSHK